MLGSFGWLGFPPTDRCAVPLTGAVYHVRLTAPIKPDDPSLARSPSPLPCAFQPHGGVLDQSGRGLVRSPNRKTAPAGRAPQHPRTGSCNPVLHRGYEGPPKSVPRGRGRRGACGCNGVVKGASGPVADNAMAHRPRFSSCAGDPEGLMAPSISRPGTWVPKSTRHARCERLPKRTGD